MRITDEESGQEGKLGGRAPRGVRPKDYNGAVQYFATVPLSTGPVLHASVFVADFEKLLTVRGRLNDSGLVEVVVHDPAERGERSELSSDLSEHNLLILPETSDIEEEEPGVVRAGHKIGGGPHLIREKGTLAEDIRSLREEGFIQVAQLDFPNWEDASVSGDWPFGDGIFSLFGGPPFGAPTWRWYWDL